MTSELSRYQSMQCPKCQSHNTQSVSVAYLQSVRTGYNGQQTISEFGRGLEPPPPRSEFWIPLCATFWVGVFVFFGIAELSSHLSEWWPRAALWIDARPIVVSAIAGGVVGLAVSISAISFNISDHAGSMNEWNCGAICKRCGHRFRH